MGYKIDMTGQKFGRWTVGLSQVLIVIKIDELCGSVDAIVALKEVLKELV